jgi:hypothetical protein
VFFTPLLVLAGPALAVTRAPAVGLTFVVVYAVGVLEGLAGIALHLRV